MDSLIVNASFYREGRQVVGENIHISSGKIVAIGQFPELRKGPVKIIDADGQLLVPGFIDLQVNGGKRKFLTHEMTEQALDEIFLDHLASGTTSMLPTIVTTSMENMLRAIDLMKTYQCLQKPGIYGLHIEGPYISKERKGAHNPLHIRKPTARELKTLLEQGEGVIKMITIAPELFTLKEVGMMKEAGIVVAAGHSAIEDDDVRPYFDNGIQCVTHLYNAMSPFHGRKAGLTGATLEADVFAGIIADGFHCSTTALKIAYRLKKGKLFLVSDATLIGDEDFEMDGLRFLHREGVYRNGAGDLAGSNITMLDAVRYMHKQAGVPLSDVIDMSSEIPAKLLNLDKQYGKIEAGFFADMILLDPELLEPVTVFLHGESVKPGQLVQTDQQK